MLHKPYCITWSCIFQRGQNVAKPLPQRDMPRPAQLVKYRILRPNMVITFRSA